MKPEDYILTEKPAGTRAFDPNMDRELLDSYAAQAQELFISSQKAILPPEVLPKEGSVKFSAELIQIRNLTRKTSEFHALVRVDFGGLHREKDHRLIAGVTPDDKLLFAVGPKPQKLFLTVDHERAIRKMATEEMSKTLKEEGYGGDLSKFVKESMKKNGLGGLGGMFGQPESPEDWWKRGEDGPPSS